MLAAAGTHLVVYGWAVAVWPRLARKRLWFFGFIALVVGLHPLTRMLANSFHDNVSAVIDVVLMLEVMVVGTAAVPIALLRAATWLAARVASSPSPSPSPSPAMTRRQLVEGTLGASFLAASGSLLGWGILRGRHEFTIEELVVRIPGLPHALEGYTIAQVSDLHAGIFVGDGLFAEGLAKVALARADLLVATGDLVDFDPSWAGMVARALLDHAPRDGVLAILGNHDYYAGARRVSRDVRQAGLDLLINEARVVRKGDAGGIAIVGVDDMWAMHAGGDGPDLRGAMKEVKDCPLVLLSHNPKSVDLWPGEVPLQLSGHTHGGQINPGFSPAKAMMPYLAGRYEVGGTTLYVNRGFGTAGPPSRIGAPPEVTKVVLVAG